MLFHGIDGRLTPELLKQGLTPAFSTRAGEVKPIPAPFIAAVRAVTEGASCLNCRHIHGLVERAPVPDNS